MNHKNLQEFSSFMQKKKPHVKNLYGLANKVSDIVVTPAN